jgi:hypothetical protein
MPKALSGDLRERVIEAVEAGRRGVRRPSALRSAPVLQSNGCNAGVMTGCVRPRGGSRSVLEAYAERILALVAEQPDRTLDEIAAAMRKRRIPGSRSALWWFLDRHGITFKKKPAGSRAAPSGRGASAAALDPAAGLS